jgi:hypothetical protein
MLSPDSMNAHMGNLTYSLAVTFCLFRIHAYTDRSIGSVHRISFDSSANGIHFNAGTTTGVRLASNALMLLILVPIIHLEATSYGRL